MFANRDLCDTGLISLMYLKSNILYVYSYVKFIVF